MHVARVRSCKDKYRLLDNILAAVHELVELQHQQTQAVIEEDPDFARFDILLHLARSRKEEAKYAYLTHVESHNC